MLCTFSFKVIKTYFDTMSTVCLNFILIFRIMIKHDVQKTNNPPAEY